MTKKIKIHKSGIPQNSKISGYREIDYRDCFVCEIDSNKDISADDIMVAFWTIMPKWLSFLFKLRDILVKPFGLKTGENGDAKLLEEVIRNGGEYRFVSVLEKSDNETIISLSDKHLTAYLSAYIEKESKIYATTLVKFHNKLGVLYFYAICPFHIIVVRNMFKTSVKHLLQ